MATELPREFQETVWARGWRDFKTHVLHDWRFIALEVVGSPVIGVLATNAWVGVYFAVGVFLAAWLSATATAPLRQRNEARARLASMPVISSGPPSVINFTLWDSHEEFPIQTAACLWEGLSPMAPQTDAVAARLLTLKLAIANDELRIENSAQRLKMELTRIANGTTIDSISDQQIVKRSALAQYAKSKEQKPAFLFPEARDVPTSKQQILRELGKLRDVEVKLRNHPPVPDNYEIWKAEFHEIRNRIRKRIEESPWSGEAGIFFTLGNKRHDWPGINAEHRMFAGILTRDIDWLADFISRHSGDWGRE